MIKKFSIGDFARDFGLLEEEITPECFLEFGRHNFEYSIIDPERLYNTFDSVLDGIEKKSKIISGKNRKNDWEDGWRESLENFVQSNFDVNTLTPRYYSSELEDRDNSILRMEGRYIKATSPNFLANLQRVLRKQIYSQYFKGFDNVYEFGCGSSFNFEDVFELYPNMKCVGLDWSNAAIEIINLLRQKKDWNIEGHRFDFFEPDENLDIRRNSVLFTFGALEQTGDQYENFLQFILRKKPDLCVNIEPIDVFYDDKKILGYLGKKYHSNRNYLKNYLPRLKELEKEKKIEIFKTAKSSFGCTFQNIWSTIVWKPVW